jgi:hypothetical protein
MDDTEIENCIIAAVRDRDGRHVAFPNANSVAVAPGPALGQSNHPRVQIERIYAIRAEHVEDQFGPHSATAADLQHAPARQLAAHPQQPPGFEPPLNGSPQRVVHQQVFHAVQ